jgi:hypothetical protein
VAAAHQSAGAAGGATGGDRRIPERGVESVQRRNAFGEPANGASSLPAVNARVYGDPNQDGNDLNDRLPGYRRHGLTGPDYATTDLRLTLKIRRSERYKLDLSADAFNLLNPDNQRVAITSNGLVTTASTFVQSSVTAGMAPYPGYYSLPGNFMKPNAAYAPRQVQLAVKFIF